MNQLKKMLLAGFLILLTSPVALAQGTQVSIKLESILEVANNKVGNNWNNFLTIKDQVLKAGDCMTFKPEKREPLEIVANVIEVDSKHSDYAKNTMLITYSDLIKIESTRFEINVDVVENSGRFEGNVAKWKFVFEIFKE